MGKLAGSKTKAVLVGATEGVSMLCHDLYMAESGTSVLGVFSDGDSGELPASLPYLGGIGALLPYLREHAEVTDVYCSLEQMTVEEASALLDYCEAHSVRFSAVPARVNSFQRRMMLRQVGYTTTLTPAPEPLRQFSGRLLKRTFDIVLSLILLLTIMPVCVIVMFVLAKRKDRGAVLAMRRREGAGGRMFDEYSFRAANNPFISGLPRIFNVFLGQMSFVGPREVVRSWVRPGITGLSQTAGNGEDGENRLRTDIWYIENWTLWMDVCILVKGIFNVKL